MRLGAVDEGIGRMVGKEPVKRWRGWHGAVVERWVVRETGRADRPKKQGGLHWVAEAGSEWELGEDRVAERDNGGPCGRVWAET